MTTIDAKGLVAALEVANKFKDKYEGKVRVDIAPTWARITSRGDVLHTHSYVDAKTETSLQFSVDRDDLLSVAKRFDGDMPLSLEGQLLLGTGKARYRLDVADADDVPALHPPEDVAPEEAALKYTGRQFLEMLLAVMHAMGADDHKPHMAGVQFDTDAVVTADGFRFVALKFPGNPELHPKVPVFLPRPVVEFLLYRVKSFLDAPVTVHVIDKKVHVYCGRTYVMCPGVEGVFPPYKTLYPTALWEAKLPAHHLAAAVEDVLALKATKGKPVTLQPNDGGFELYSAAPGGSVNSFVEAQFSAPPALLKFAGAHLYETAKCLKPETMLRIECGNGTKPAAFHGTALNGWEHTTLLMPTR